ncbi:MAG TPA: hypothetical protein VNA30_04240 [Mycobacteriales bacterium]|nr:hypothetical protein [Mycobacteriales bacterium]
MFRAGPLLTACALGAALLLPAVPASAAGERPVAYINPDTGKVTENSGVRTSSECESPDRADTMALGDEATGKGNVHVDACLFQGSNRVDVKAAFEVTGVGTIAACPDADKAGPKTATKSATSCLQDGYEEANKEYHVRVVSATAGLQTVRFCADPEGNGCADAERVSSVRITWGAPVGGVAAGGSRPVSGGGGPAGSAVIALLAVLAALSLAGATAAGRGRAQR